ncbi:MAG: PepSY domain-containing protein [Oscillospiraceae bacterium]|nr:PepSY domain-containing protein [Oscillospiraceae bacterium]
MKRKIIILSALAAALMLLCACGQSSSQLSYIGVDAAKAQALSQAGLTASSVQFTATDLCSRDGVDYYSLAFTCEGETYEYDVDALTGIVIDSRTPETQLAAATADAGEDTESASTAETSDTAADAAATTAGEDSLVTDADTYYSADAAQQTTAATTTTATAAATTTTTTTQTTDAAVSGTQITVEEAKAAALAHAGLTAGEVTFTKQKLDYEHGHSVYDIEFYTADYAEYDYEIDAATGEVLSFDYDSKSRTQSDSSAGIITEARAKEIALAQVSGATAADIRDFELDRDDGQVQYEGKIIYNGMEYEFEIDAYSGAIRSWDAESIYD